MSGNYSFVIEQNSDFNRTMTVKDSSGAAVNLTGKTVRLVAKAADGTEAIDLTEGNGITVDAVNGKITIALADSVTEAYTFDVVKYNLKVGQSIVLKGNVSLVKEWE